VKELKVVSLIAAQPGIDLVSHSFPQAKIYVCAVDAQLNQHKFIVPGLGDAGDRTFNTLPR
jgi:uracil phosphoribosyltransferase